MSELEQALRSLPAQWPETPPLAAAVEGRLLAERRRRALPRRALAVALVTLLVGGGTAVAAVPALRDFVRDLFGGAVDIREVPRLPRPAPGADLGVGQRLALREAARRVGFRPVYPRAAGTPRFHATRRQFAAVYDTGARRLLFTAFRGDVPLGFAGKLAGPGTEIRRVRVGGGRGLWLAGEPHIFYYRRPGGAIAEEAVRLASNTLLWPRRGLVLRLEGAATLREALRLAASVR